MTLVGRGRKIAVIMATHNRRDQTVSCLVSLTTALKAVNVAAEVFLADAGSSDGTVLGARRAFPSIRTLEVPRDFYWAQAMRVAWEAAQAADHEFILWLNDDTILDVDAIERLLSTSSAIGHRGIVSGAMRDMQGRVTYAGYRRGTALRPLTMTQVVPNQEIPVQCDAVNGNLVLIPRYIDSLIGGFPRRYVHSLADLDYTLTASQRFSIPVVLCPGTAGVCPRNPLQGSWQDRTMSFKARFRQQIGPKGLPPRSWARLHMRHGGPLWPINTVSPYLRVVLEGLAAARSR